MNEESSGFYNDAGLSRKNIEKRLDKLENM